MAGVKAWMVSVGAAIFEAFDVSRCLVSRCDDLQIETRWIEVDQKQNKPTEILLEVTRFCRVCGRIESQLYLNEEQCRREGIETPERTGHERKAS